MAKIHVFADESGNFDFRDRRKHPGASRFFAVGTMVVYEDAAVELLNVGLDRLRRDLTATGYELPSGFHASEDKQQVRDAVYDLLGRHQVRFDVTLLEKAKAQPQTRVNDPTFYKYAWFYHFKTLARRVLKPGDDLIVVAASIGTKRLRSAFRGAVEDVVSQCCDWRITRRVTFWDMGTEPCLQAADYGLWAVARYWENGDDRALSQIPGKVASQFDLWRNGKTFYY